MLDAWNEKESRKIRLHIEASLTEYIYVRNPTIALTEIDVFEKMVH